MFEGFEGMGKILMVIGLSLAALGGILTFASKIGLGKLPGDILIRKGNFTFYFPVLSMIILSLLLSFVLNLFLRR